MSKRVGIIGAGASGMAAAIAAARAGAVVTVLESGDRPGKKILATGNGKCNLGNLDLECENYYSGDTDFLKERLREFGVQETIDFFDSIGLSVRAVNGYLYPFSEQASSVLDALRFEIKSLGVHIICGQKIQRIVKRKSTEDFLVTSEDKAYTFDAVILACGGMAAPKTGSDGSGYQLARQLGHTVSKVVPSLVQLKCREDWFKSVAGVRAKACISVVDKGKIVASEYGELQFNDYGISGIPVFQLSRIVNYWLTNRKEVEVQIDFFPEFEGDNFSRDMYDRRAKLLSSRTVEEYFTGLLNKKIMLLLIRMAGIKTSDNAITVDKSELKKVYEMCRALKVHVVGNKGFDNAQVCAGGVPLNEIKRNMESKQMQGLYFAGEILDVDGKCGGYNLHWAWCSGIIAGRSAAKQEKAN